MRNMSDEDYEAQVDDETPPTAAPDDEDPWPAAHPRFAAHFTDAIYTDWADDVAPFGGDEASDALAEFYDNADDFGANVTLAQLAADQFDDWPEILDDREQLDEFGDAVLVSLGFGIIRLTGTIDAESRSLLAAAILRRGAFFEGEESFATMSDDLERFES
jgi:uncharacterized protein YfeS